MSESKRSSSKKGCFIFGLPCGCTFLMVCAFVAFFGGIFLVQSLLVQNTKSNVTITVISKTDVALSTGNGHQFRVTARLANGQIETFEVADAPAAGFYDTSDVFGLLLPGHTYSVIVYGVRNEVLSQFRDIIAINSEVQTTPTAS